MTRKLLMLGACMLVIALAAGCAAGTAPAGEETGAVGLPSPMHECADFQELTEACPGIVMNDVRAEAGRDILDPLAEVSYCWISIEPVIAQIQFVFNGHEYCYRAAACASEADMTDIAGVYESFETSEELQSNDNSMSGGSYTMRRSADDAKGLCTWYYAPTGCQYSLWTPDGAGGDGEMERVMDYLLPIVSLPDGSPVDARP